MAPLAIFLAQRGCVVSGFDDFPNPEILLLLRRWGVDTVSRPPVLPDDCKIFVHTPALRHDDPLPVDGSRRNLEVFSRGVYLAQILENQRLVAVVGSHGKTMSTALLVTMLEAENFPCNYLIGGQFCDKRPPALWRGAPWTVAEIDESESSLELFSPEVTLALNLSLDHDAYYGSLGELQDVFGRLFKRTRDRIFLPENEESLRPFHGWRGVSFIPPAPSELKFEFNRTNGVAAAAVVHHLCPGRGPITIPLVPIRRRQMVLFSGEGGEVIADYAHHPREVAAFLSAFWNSKSVLIFQPHRYSRTASHREEFADILRKIPRAILMPTYGAFEDYDELGTAEVLAEATGTQIPCLSGEKLIAHLDHLRGEERLDRFLYVGAGSIFSTAVDHGNRLRVEAFRNQLKITGIATAPVENEPLSRHCTLRIGGPARFFGEPQSIDELRNLITAARRAQMRYFFLGNGSNLLIADGGFFGLILRPRGEFWQKITFESGKIRIRGGASLPSLSRLCLEHSIGGFEFCAGIPGTIGGAIRMNAGAFGHAIGDAVEFVTYLDGHGEIVVDQKVHFSYRHSSLPVDAIVLEVALRIPSEPGNREAIRTKQGEMALKRRERQPSKPSAGSVFRNPPGDSAGRLIEAAGLRGLVRGGAQISEKHGNFIVNNGGACSDDILDLFFTARRTVSQRFNIDLVGEICYLGDSWEGPL
jgi:UDP-N-acetylenolpyruvoylglucosamine reductase